MGPVRQRLKDKLRHRLIVAGHVMDLMECEDRLTSTIEDPVQAETVSTYSGVSIIRDKVFNGLATNCTRSEIVALRLHGIILFIDTCPEGSH